MTPPLVLPLMVPLLTAVATLLAWRSRVLQRRLALGGTLVLLATDVALLRSVWLDGIRSTQIGGWPAPFGITLVADLFSAIMLVLGGIIGSAVLLYSLATMDPRREESGYYPLLQLLLLGICGAFLAGDVFNLYVWFEVMLIASFVLLALGGERPQLEGAIKYVTINLVSSALLLTAVALLYGLVGTLNLADLARQAPSVEHRGFFLAVAMLFLTTFGVKAAIFPFFFWLPASYHTPPVAVSAIFSGLLTKVGVYGMIRFFTLVFVQDAAVTHSAILVLSGLTMLTGVLGALAQNEFRRLLSFHIVSQIGYMIMGLGLFSPVALAASVYYIAHHILVKTNLFLVSGLVARAGGTSDLKHLGALSVRHPWLALSFMIPALSLAGLPPLSGFFAKLALIQAGLELEQYLIVAIALLVSLLTLLSMTKIWNEAFWKPAPHAEPRATPPLAFLPVWGLALLTVLMGLDAGPIFQVAMRAGEQLMHPEGYMQAVSATASERGSGP